MRKILGYILLSLGVLLGIATAVFIVQISINCWPRPMEPPMWTVEDLPISEASQKNGWNALPKSGKDARLKFEDKISDDLSHRSIMSTMFSFREVDPLKISPDVASRFWADMEEHAISLAKENMKYFSEILNYKKILGYPEFTDNDPASFNSPRVDIAYLRNLHELGYHYIMERALQNDWEEVYSFWTRIFQQDRAWLSSARSPLSHIASIICLSDDLKLLALLLYRHWPEDISDIEAAVRGFDPSPISYQRPMIYDYLLATNEAGQLAEQNQGIVMRVMFNEALVRRDINRVTGKYDVLIKNPSELSGSLPEEIDIEIDKMTEGPFWWFYDPAGKVVVRIFFFDYSRKIKKFYDLREGLIKLQKIIIRRFDSLQTSP